MPEIDLNFAIIAPLLSLVAGALVVLVLELILPEGQARRWCYAAALAAAVLAGWQVTQLWPQVAQASGGAGLTGFLGAVVADRFSLVFSGVILATTLASTLIGGPSTRDVGAYLSLLLLAAAGMLDLASAGNLMTIFVGIEMLSLSLYVAVGYERQRATAREGALKYFLLGSVASAVLLYGFALIYGAAGSTSLAAIGDYWRLRAAQGLGPGGLLAAGLAMVLVGFGFKMALVPFHLWAPDAYQGAATPVTAFMSVATKAAAFAGLVRFVVAVVPVEAAAAGFGAGKALAPLWLLGALSMLAGSLGALRQTNVKRILAYSGIANAGYLTVALPGLTERGIGAGAFYLAAYALMNVGAFAVVAAVAREYGDHPDGEAIEAFNGLMGRRPALAVAMAVFLFSLTGLPPTGGLVGKVLLVGAAVNAGALGMAFLLIASSVVLAFTYLRIVRAMFLAQPVGAGAGAPVWAAAGAAAGAAGAAGAGSASAVPVYAAYGAAAAAGGPGASTSSGWSQQAAAVDEPASGGAGGGQPLSAVVSSGSPHPDATGPQESNLRRWARGLVIAAAGAGTVYLGVMPQGLIDLTRNLLGL